MLPNGLFDALMPWHWWLAGVLLLIMEVFAPGVFFMWLGIAAGLVGLMSWVIPGISWELQVLAFSILSVVTVMLGRKWLDLRPIQTDRPTLNRRGEQYIGRTLTLPEPIINGQGHAKVDDSIWKVRGPDCPVGSRVRVNAVDGSVLLVELV